jgi:hypothetical protein
VGITGASGSFILTGTAATLAYSGAGGSASIIYYNQLCQGA